MTYRLECVSNCKSGITPCAIEWQEKAFFGVAERTGQEAN